MTSVQELALKAKSGARGLAAASTDTKNAVLHRFASLLRENASAIVEANAKDMQAGEEKKLSAALLDRLKLDAARIEGVAQGVEQVASLPDPVGRLEDCKPIAGGMLAGRMRIPLGLIGLIYESRPNVTADAAALCIKSGNGALLRGGSEAFESNTAIARLCAQALSENGLKEESVSLLPTTDREVALEMIRLSGVLDLVIPRGGEGLIRFVTENATVPVVQHFKGVCHVYVDASANLEQAVQIVVNSKTHRPGVCNAAETLLVDQAIAETFVPTICKRLESKQVELRGDARTKSLVPTVKEATPEDWDQEYLDLTLSVAVVDGVQGALDHIAAHGSGHTECIVTENYSHAQRFLREADASCVLVNASTRFNDGFQLGLGAEMGISTTKLHAFGPMGLEELCARKWVVYGSGQVRK